MSEILARASELDAAGSGGTQAPVRMEEGRLSLTDLEAVAGEVGIDPAHIRTAAREQIVRRSAAAAPPAHPSKVLLGLPLHVDAERVIPVELDEDTWGRMVHSLREHTGAPGVTTTLAGVREWHSKADGGPDTVTLRAEPLPPGATRLHLGRNTSASRSMVVGVAGAFALMLAVLLVLALLVPPAEGLAGFAAVLGVVAGAGAFLTGGTWLAGRLQLGKIGKENDALLDRLELLALKRGGG